jgi:hypothetical protein
MEYITRESQCDDAWVCLCGNTPHSDGFSPCDPGGKPVEPTEERWPIPIYACDRCGRIIHQLTLQVIGRRAKRAMINKAMERKIQAGECLDIASYRVPGTGTYLLPSFEEGKDYADAVREEWIWSIGRERETGHIIASTDTRFYQNPQYECLFLR